MNFSVLIGKKYSPEWWLDVFLSVVWAKILIGYARGIILRVPIIGEYTDIIEYLFYIIPLIGALPIIINRIRIFDFVFYLSCVGFLIFSYINAIDTRMIDANGIRFIFSIVPYYFAGRLIDNISRLEKPFTIISIVSIFAGIFYMGIYVKTGMSSVEFDDDNMGASYALLPYILFLIASTFMRFSVFKLIISIVAVIFSLSLGTRGPVLCITVLSFLMVLFNTHSKHKNLILLLIALVGTLAYIYIMPIMFWLLDLFTNLDLSTRIIDKFLAGAIDDDSGRNSIQYILWNLLAKDDHPFGYGLFSSWNYIGIYPHNFILDIFFSFGYIIGSLLIVWFVVLPYKSLKKADLQQRNFLFVLFCSSFVKLLVSGTFVFEPYIFFLIGYCITLSRKGNHGFLNIS